MRCLITGGAGFIGSHTVDALIKKGYKVRILDDLSHPNHKNGKPSYLHQGAEFILGSVCNKEDLQKALQDVDFVYHFAAYKSYLPDFGKFFYVNSVGTGLLYEVIIEEKLEIKKVIVASSQAVYGEGKYRCPSCNKIKYPNIRSVAQLENGQYELCCDTCKSVLQAMWTNENRVNPQNQYAISKYTQELTSLTIGKRYRIPTCCLRYSIVQGPRQSIYNAYSGACRIFGINQFFNKRPSIFEDGKQVRDFVNIYDVVDANITVLESTKVNNKVFNVGGGDTYSILEFANIVSKVFGKNISSKLTGEYRYGDTRHIFSDISRLGELGWKPKFHPEDSVKSYKEWLEELPIVDNVIDDFEKEMKKLSVIRKSKKNPAATIKKTHKSMMTNNRGRNKTKVVSYS